MHLQMSRFYLRDKETGDTNIHTTANPVRENIQLCDIPSIVSRLLIIMLNPQ